MHTSCFFSQMIIHPDNSANQQLEQNSQVSDNILWCSQAQAAQLNDGWAVQQLSTACGMIKHHAGQPGAPVPKEFQSKTSSKLVFPCFQPFPPGS